MCLATLAIPPLPAASAERDCCDVLLGVGTRTPTRYGESLD